MPNADGVTSHDSPGGIQLRLPTTSLGRWSMWLGVAFLAMFALNSVFVGIFGATTDPQLNYISRTYMPYYGIAMLLVGFSAGIVALVAVIRQRERSLVTMLTVLPALFVVVLLVGELVFPH